MNENGLPVREEKSILMYLTRIAATTDPDDFASQILPSARWDSFSSFVNKVYATTSRLASKDQKASMKALIDKGGVKTE